MRPVVFPQNHASRWKDDCPIVSLRQQRCVKLYSVHLYNVTDLSIFIHVHILVFKFYIQRIEVT